MKLNELPVLILDCQTTGASPKNGHLLELGWMLASASEAGTVITSLIKLPEGVELPQRSKKITGITEQDMTAARPATVDINELR